MDALLLAAGLGTRLRPLTDDMPKPLIKVAGKPLIAWNIEHLVRRGVKRIVVNTHYLHEKLEAYLDSEKATWGVEVLISHEPVLLDTGGALKKALPLLRSDQIIVWNSDTIFDPALFLAEGGSESEFDMFLRVSQDNQKTPLITLLMKSASRDLIDRFGSLGLSSSGRISEFLGVDYGSKDESDPLVEQVVFAGVSIVRREIENFFPAEKEVFSLTRDLFPQVLQNYADMRNNSKSDRIGGGIWASKFTSYWNDVGTIERLEDASKHMNCILRLHEQDA